MRPPVLLPLQNPRVFTRAAFASPIVDKAAPRSLEQGGGGVGVRCSTWTAGHNDVPGRPRGEQLREPAFGFPRATTGAVPPITREGDKLRFLTVRCPTDKTAFATPAFVGEFFPGCFGRDFAGFVDDQGLPPLGALGSAVGPAEGPCGQGSDFGRLAGGGGGFRFTHALGVRKREFIALSSQAFRGGCCWHHHLLLCSWPQTGPACSSRSPALLYPRRPGRDAAAAQTAAVTFLAP